MSKQSSHSIRKYSVLALLLLSCALIAGACGPGEDAGESQLTPTSQSGASTATTVTGVEQTPELILALGDPTSVSEPNYDALEVIADAVYGLTQVTSGRMTEVATAGETTFYSVTYTVVLPDRVHRLGTDGRGEIREAITIGDDNYLRIDYGAWEKVEGEGRVIRFDSVFTQGRSVDHFLQSISDITQLQPEPLDGEPTRVYRYRYDTIGGRDTHPITQTLWISEIDGLPRKAEIVIRDGAGRPGQLLDQKLTYLFYDLNADIEIESPDVPHVQ